MTRQELAHYQAAQYTQNVEKQAQAELKTALIKYAAQAALTGTFDTETYANDCERIIKEASTKSANKQNNDSRCESVGMYMNDPMGKIQYVPPKHEIEFIQKYALSGSTRPMQVWSIGELLQQAAQVQQEKIMGIVHQGIADGLDPKVITKDLEVHINDGTQQVLYLVIAQSHHIEAYIGHWGNFLPDTEFGETVRGFEDPGMTSDDSVKMEITEYKKMISWALLEMPYLSYDNAVKKIGIFPADTVERVHLRNKAIYVWRVIKTGREFSVSFDRISAHIGRINPKKERESYSAYYSRVRPITDALGLPPIEDVYSCNINI